MGCCESTNNKKNLNNRNQFDQNLNNPQTSLQNEFPIEVKNENQFVEKLNEQNLSL